jgi:N-acetylmuramoyl-L-alanine amidase
MKKPLRYLVIHCTATPEGRQVSSDEIRRWHTAPKKKGGRGWKQVGYTDMIHLDGTIERLVTNNEDDWVDPWEITNGAKAFNSYSRHIVYVGGLASDTKTPKDTRTPEQLEAMRKYVLRFHSKHPKVKIIGHNEIANKACPCFDVHRWLCSIGICQKDMM